MAASVAPLVLPIRANGTGGDRGRIRVGQIGCGRIARGHDLPGVLASGLADVVAVCDVDARRMESTRSWLEERRRESGAHGGPVAAHGDCRELLARPDIDAVVISTPDHHHAEQALRALRAGKDVYLQKPFTLTYAESVLLRDEVARTRRILQVGSQQRSWGDTQQFRRACEFVRSGRVGRLQRVEIGLPADPTAPDQPPMPVPPGLDFDAWLGPAPEAEYTEQRVHSPRDHTSRPGWLRHDGYTLGMITGWGAHHFDTALWGMDAERVAPLRAEGRAEFPPHRIWNVHGSFEVQLEYPGGVRIDASDRFPNGVRFVGDEGWIFVSRGSQGVTDSDPVTRGTRLGPLAASDERLLGPGALGVQFPPSDSHHRNWLECVRARTEPLAPAAAAHGANMACILAWIAMKRARPLEWDAAAGRFVGDAEADALLTRPERGRYGALKLAAAGGAA